MSAIASRAIRSAAWARAVDVTSFARPSVGSGRRVT
jgi:hypothetical protein